MTLNLDGIDFSGLSRPEALAVLADAAIASQGEAAFAGHDVSGQARDDGGRWAADAPADPFAAFKKKLSGPQSLFAPAPADVRPPAGREKTLRELSAVQKRDLAAWDMPRPVGLDHASIRHLPTGRRIESGLGDEYDVRDAAGRRLGHFRTAGETADFIEGAPPATKEASDLAPVKPAKAGSGKLFDFALDACGRLAAFAGDGHWVTIGAVDHHGGTPVYIENGRITKGAPSLTGKRIDALREEAKHPSEEKYDRASAEADRLHGEAVKANQAAEAAAVGDRRDAAADAKARAARAEHRKAEAEARRAFQGRRRYEARVARENARAAWGKRARAIGHKPEHLHQLAAEMMAHAAASVEDKTTALQSARKVIASYGGDWRTAHLVRDRGGDADSVKGIDVAADILARSHPHLFPNRETEHASDRLFDMLEAGNPRPMSEDDAYSQALEELSRYPSSPPSEKQYRKGAGKGVKAKVRPAYEDEVPFAADAGGRPAEFYDPNQPRHPAGSREGGRWTQGHGDAMVREHARAAAKAFLAAKGAPTRQELSDLGGQLSRLTVRQLREFKAEHGLKASGPDKQQLVAAVGKAMIDHRAKAAPYRGRPKDAAVEDWRDEQEEGDRMKAGHAKPADVARAAPVMPAQERLGQVRSLEKEIQKRDRQINSGRCSPSTLAGLQAANARDRAAAAGLKAVDSPLSPNDPQAVWEADKDRQGAHSFAVHDGILVVHGLDPNLVDPKPESQRIAENDRTLEHAPRRAKAMLEIIRTGGDFYQLPPPQYTMKPDGRFQIYDGNARTMAYRTLGKRVPAAVIVGDKGQPLSSLPAAGHVPPKTTAPEVRNASPATAPAYAPPASAPRPDEFQRMTGAELRRAVSAKFDLSKRVGVYTTLFSLEYDEARLKTGKDVKGRSLSQGEKERLQRSVIEAKAKLGKLLRGEDVHFSGDALGACGRFAAFATATGADEGEWRTIHGAHVFIGKGGSVEKGPAHLVGKHASEIQGDHTEHDPVAATRALHESMGQGSAPHGGPEKLAAKVDRHLAELAKLPKAKLDEVWHKGLGRAVKHSSKASLLTAIRQTMITRAGAYDRPFA